MENLYRLMLSPALAFAKDASERFDKGALLQIHEFGLQQMEAAAGSTFHSVLAFTEQSGGSGGGSTSSAPLERLNTISFTEMQVGEIHRGRVMYGTLCAEAFRISGVMTLLEDGNGLALRLVIYNSAPYQADIKRLYPKGAKVAVREPCFKRAADGSILVCVDNPANVVMLTTQKEKRTDSLLDVDVEDEREKGNRCFREKKWDAAAEYYTKSIDAALLQLKESSNGNDNMKYTSLLHSYSNRAETCLKMMEFKRALEDSDEALRIDAGNFKALYRKGRALLGLRRYAAACEYLEKADRASHGLGQVRHALCQAETLHAQSRIGKYDISDYLLGRASSPPDVADFVGNVEIKMIEDGCGRGLYATRETRTGQLLLVSNAVAIVYENAFNTVLHVDHPDKTNASQEELVAAVLTAAGKSQRLLRQLYSLNESSAPRNLYVPEIDLFKTDGQEEEDEKLQVDVNRIRDITLRNSSGGARVLGPRDENFNGLWLLLSFINHSCLPNSTWLEVGSAMFIHATKPIEKGEEITIPYFDTLVPLAQREAMSEGWGFKCMCRRCILEQSLTAELAPLNAQFEDLHDKSMGQSIVLGVDLRTSSEFARLYVKVDEIIRSSPQLKTEEEKNWIRASYVYPYFDGAKSNELLPAGFVTHVPSIRETMEAIQNTEPGNILNLLIAARALLVQQSEEFKRWVGDECQTFLTRRDSLYRARDACIRVFGRHSEDVLKALVLQHGR